MSLTSAGGGYRFGLRAASISPASLKRHRGKEILKVVEPIEKAVADSMAIKP